MPEDCSVLPELSWADLVQRVEPLIFRIEAGGSLGTGFVISISSARTGHRRLAIATAWHVVEAAASESASVELFRADGSSLSGQTTLPVTVMQIGPKECDTALLLVETKDPLLSPEDLLPIPLKTMLPRGSELGWVGYPGLVAPELCFFRGAVSGFQEKPPLYLVDGVAINGVSGGPAFARNGLLVGFVSAYLPNIRGSGHSLPGLLIATPINLVRYWMEAVFGAEVRSPVVRPRSASHGAGAS